MTIQKPAGLETLARRIRCYQRCPFAKDSVPGSVLQHILSSVRGDSVLDTYDFVDNISPCGCIGWQVKSTKEDTPVTWKRAKLPEKDALIRDSKRTPAGLQKLGNAIIEFCNAHAQESLQKYNLEELRLARLIVFNNGDALYYERALCTRARPEIFAAREYTWSWSIPKRSRLNAKEQLPALHGIDTGGQKCWAWHGLGENQLHFAGERQWWPRSTVNGSVGLKFTMPNDTHRLDWGRFTDALSMNDSPQPGSRQEGAL
jgi:hypothetical protein